MTTNSCEELFERSKKVLERGEIDLTKLQKLVTELEEIKNLLTDFNKEDVYFQITVQSAQNDNRAFSSKYKMPDEIVAELQSILEKRLEKIDEILDKCEKCWEL